MLKTACRIFFVLIVLLIAFKLRQDLINSNESVSEQSQEISFDMSHLRQAYLESERLHNQCLCLLKSWPDTLQMTSLKITEHNIAVEASGPEQEKLFFREDYCDFHQIFEQRVQRHDQKILITFWY